LCLLYGTRIASEWVQLPNSHPMFCRVKPITYMLIGGVRAMSNVLRVLTRQRRAAQDTMAQTEEPLAEEDPLSAQRLPQPD
jgi:hypothetical protein